MAHAAPATRRQTTKAPLMSCISSQLSSFIKLVSLGDLRRRERPDLDMTQCDGGFPGGEAQRLVPAGLDPRRDPPVAVIDGDDLLVVDPAADHLSVTRTRNRYQVLSW